MAKGTFTECPECGARVTKEKLRRHINKVHGEGMTKQAPAPRPTRPATVRFPWKAMAALAVIGLLVLGGYWFLGRGNTEGGTSGNGSPISRTAVISTSKGTITLHLDLLHAPKTSGNFITLADAGKYNNNRFHRVIPNFVVQGGAVEGAGALAWEPTGLTNKQYSVAMARSGDGNDPGSKDTATSQFFINLVDNNNLDAFTYPYVVFGHVVGGADVVAAIGNLGSQSGEPTETVTIISIRIVH